jgi:hypothetical protein
MACDRPSRCRQDGNVNEARVVVAQLTPSHYPSFINARSAAGLVRAESERSYGLAPGADELLIPAPGSGSCLPTTTTSTRRLRARPASVLLLAIG